MSQEKLVILAFAPGDSRKELIQKERANLQAAWQSQTGAGLKVLVLENAAAQQLHIAITHARDHLIAFHLAATADSFPKENESHDWLAALGNAPKLKFAFLSGCASPDRVGEMLEKGVGTVLGSQYSPDEKAVFRFSEMFYFQLLAQASLLHAFEKSADAISERYSWDYTPSATFFVGKKLPTEPFPWGLYLYPARQELLSWKLPAQAQEPVFFVPKGGDIVRPDIAPTRKKRTFSFDLNFPFFQKVYQLLFRSISPVPSRSEVPPSPRISPGVKPSEEAGSESGGLEIHTDEWDEGDISAKIAVAKDRLSPDRLPELTRLEDQWASLQASFQAKTLIKELVEGKLPFLELTPGRIEEIIEKTLAEEVFALRSQLIEKELDALLQPVARGFVVRGPIAKSEVGKYHALIIGINQYDDIQIPSLTGALNDAKALHQLLSAKYFFDHIQLLENPDRDEIIDAFDELDFRVAEGDNVLIFYAGHGKWDKDSEIGYWMPSNAQHNRSRNWIENSTIHNSIKRLKPCQHILLISDSCFSGALLDTREVMGPAIGQDDKEVRILYDAKSRQILTSGAKEPVPDDSSFFKYLIESLDNAAEKTLSTHSLFYQVRTKVLNDLRQGQNPQVGKILHAGDDGGDFVFFQK